MILKKKEEEEKEKENLIAFPLSMLGKQLNILEIGK